MMRNIIINVGMILLTVCLLLASCRGEVDDVDTELLLTPVFSIPQLNFELDDFIGEEVWVCGYYGDDGISGDGYGFLVTDFDMLLVDEKLPENCCVLLDGELTDYTETGAEILVYGEVKDFGEEYDAFTLEPTALITVEQHHLLSPAEVATTSLDLRLDASFEGAVPQSSSVAQALDVEDGGKKATEYDRALILSGGIDKYNNHDRYKDNIKMAYEKLIHLGFKDEHIVVHYYDGSAIYLDGRNIIDADATKKAVNATLTKFQNEMIRGSTLVIFVTDHGTGYDSDECWDGALPALSVTGDSGKAYLESAICIDLGQHVYQWIGKWMTPNQELFKFSKNKVGRVEVYMWKDGEWVYKGYDKNGDGRITELEVNKDIDGKPGLTSDGQWLVEEIEKTCVASPWIYGNATWDTDRDCSYDVIATWNNTAQKYVLKRWENNAWHKISESATGSHIIQGVDWDLDGKMDSEIGFHEGINLLGKEVLWDYELRDILKPLYDKDICILVEMASCFSGGFVENLKGVVEIIVTFAVEDTVVWTRWDTARKTPCTFCHLAFVENLAGIDWESWKAAFDAAKSADRGKWKADYGYLEQQDLDRYLKLQNFYQYWTPDTHKDCQVSVTFVDPILEEIIRVTIGIPEGPIYPSDLEGVTSLDASESNIMDITGLEYCPNLEYINLGFNGISNISPLANLTSLTYLILAANEISDISPLADLTSLTWLILADNQITDISPLAYLTNLTWLNLCCGNQISDIFPLANLTNLTTLSLSENQISNISPLANLTSLSILSLSSNQITDISPLANLTSLTELSLCCGNQIIDISPLANLTNLTDLNLCCGNQISDISALANLTSLTWLGLCCGNQISDISPLVQNEGLGTGDYISLWENPLSSYSVNIYIPQLEARGVTVDY